MPEQKISIPNRTGKRIVLIVDYDRSDKGLAFVMHGLGGFKEQEQIAVCAQAFKEHQLTAVRFDVRNTFGESEGLYEDANVTNYLEDLEDVIAWAASQPWYHEPFYLAGQSLGGICVLLYARAHPLAIKGLAPISTVISGELQLSHASPEERKTYEESGWKSVPSVTRPGTFKNLRWHQFADDILRYDVLPLAPRLRMPVFLAVGSVDTSTPAAEQRLLFERLTCAKELHIIEGAPHVLRTPDHLLQFKGLLSAWVGNVESGVLRTHL